MNPIPSQLFWWQNQGYRVVKTHPHLYLWDDVLHWDGSGEPSNFVETGRQKWDLVGIYPTKQLGGLSHNVVKWSCMLPMFSWVYRPIQTVTCSWKWQISILTQWDDYYTIYKSRMLDLSVFNSDSGAHERQHCMTPTGRVTPGSGQSCVAPPLLETSISSRTNRATWQSSGAVKETVRNQAIFFGHWKKI